MRDLLRPIVAVCVLLAWPLTVQAQPVGESKADLARWDVTFLAAALTAENEPENAPDYSDGWFNTGQGVVIGGYRWTTHFRSEFGFSASGEGRQYINDIVTVRGFPQPVYVSGEQYTTVREFSVTGVWQFLENQWVHPFLEFGVGVDWERTRMAGPFSVNWGDPRLPIGVIDSINERFRGTTTETSARALIGGGGRFYMTPRAFFRTDARAAVSSRLDRLSLRAGFGVEF